MSVLVVGVSHRTAPVEVLERLALDGDGVAKLATDATGTEHVAEAAVLSTCNRIEIYADVDRFHGSVEELSRLLCERSDGLSADPAELVPYLYVHYDDGAVSHLFHVAAGLDSMAVGEAQILGQAREALRLGQELGTVGPALNSLFQQALRVGKRSRTETDIDRAAPSMVTAALDRAEESVGPVAGKHVLVIGAGAMASLATATAARLRAGMITVVNRTEGRAERLAGEYGVRSLPLDRLDEALPEADIVISCTGSTRVMISAESLVGLRGGSPRPVVLIDLALPHDVEPAVAELPGVTLIDLRRLAADLSGTATGEEVEEVRQIVGQEISAFVTARRAASVTPTVVALRSMATGVVDAEIERLLARIPDLDDVSREEIEMTVRRVADKLLHQPTVRVKELANEAGAVSYAEALRELFALDPFAVDAVTRPEGIS